jgi:hypothetical protein
MSLGLDQERDAISARRGGGTHCRLLRCDALAEPGGAVLVQPKQRNLCEVRRVGAREGGGWGEWTELAANTGFLG